MERNSEAIGREEFDSVWDRVTAPIAAGILPMSQAKGAPSVAPTPTVTQMPATFATAKTPTATPTGVAGGSRVAPTEAEREAEAVRLREIMSRVSASARECCEAAKQCRGAAAETLRCIERSCRATNRDLNTQHYILTGECCCPGSVIAPTCCVRETLRRICENEAETREMCVNAAETTQFPSLATAYARAARAAGCRERAAERLLGKIGCS